MEFPALKAGKPRIELARSGRHHGIPFDEERGILLLEDVGLTGLYIHDCLCLAEIARILGKAEEAERLIHYIPVRV